jgi:hypothetical protein
MDPATSTIEVYRLGRGRDGVANEVREMLKAGDWTVVSDAMEGDAILIAARKQGATYRARFTGDVWTAAIRLEAVVP